MNYSSKAALARTVSSRVIRRIGIAITLAVVLTMFVLAACSAPQNNNTATNPSQQAATDWKDVEQALGKAGSMQPGDVYKVSLPRSDLKVTVSGVELKPALALGSWVAFKKNGEMSIVMGDLVLTEDEVT